MAVNATSYGGKKVVLLPVMAVNATSYGGIYSLFEVLVEFNFVFYLSLASYRFCYRFNWANLFENLK